MLEWIWGKTGDGMGSWLWGRIAGITVFCGTLLLLLLLLLLRWWRARGDVPVVHALREHFRTVLTPQQRKRDPPGFPPRVGVQRRFDNVDLEQEFAQRRGAVLTASVHVAGGAGKEELMRLDEEDSSSGGGGGSNSFSHSSSGSINAQKNGSAAFSFENSSLDTPSKPPVKKNLYARYMPNAKKLYDMLGYAYELDKDNMNVPVEPLEGDVGYIHFDEGGDHEYLRASRSSNDGVIPRELGDFNGRFQAIMEMMSSFNNNTPLAIRIRAGRDLINLSQDFVWQSTSYGRIIISEAFLPDEEKTIKPCNVQLGMAGGTKFIVGNIMFKFAMDTHALLGSDYAAAKVAGHELKGLLAVFNAKVVGLSVPLMTLVDYRGFRLIAMSILPISAMSIRTGSNDYGQTVHSEAPETCVQALKTMAHRLNIKPHYCGLGARRPIRVYGPVDLEGHCPADGRFYLLDFSRVMPPETPKPGTKMAHLYRLLRPEFVKTYEAPLCSDGYSTFIKAHDAAKHNREIAKATLVLQREIIPQFAPEFSEIFLSEVSMRGWQVMETFHISEALHRRGINVRYLGLIRKHTMNSDVRTFLLVEIFARVVKNLLRLQLREKMKALRLPLEEPYRRLVVDYLNLILGESENSDRYWNTVIRRNVLVNFADALTLEESSEHYFLKPSLTYFSSPDCDGKFLLFCRIVGMTGLEISQDMWRDLRSNPNSWAPRGDQPFDDGDLIRLDVRIKHMNIITHTLGVQYLHRANAKYGTEPAAAERLLTLSMQRFTEALDTDPRNPETLCNLALVQMRLLEVSSSALSSHQFDEGDAQVQRCQGYFLRALHEAPSDSRILGHYARFLEKIGRRVEAEEYYLKSLEADPNNDGTLLDYGNFLSERGQFEWAEQMFRRIRQVE